MANSRVGRRVFIALAVVAATASATASALGPGRTEPARSAPKPAAPPATATYGAWPLSFEVNRGQTDPRVKFLARTKGYDLFMTSGAAVLAVHGNGAAAAVRMNLLGADPEARPVGESPLVGKVSYLGGTDPSARRSSIPTFGTVGYSGVYPGIDLLYKGSDGQLEYDFAVAPGADPNVIRLGIEGADGLRLDDAGNLVVATAAGDVVQHRPVIYQEVGGARRPVYGNFALDGSQVGFTVDTYDHTRPLVIDPTLAYSSYLGGSDDDEPEKVKVDGEGHAFVVGTTVSLDFPTTPGVLRTSPNQEGFYTSFLTELAPDGTGPVWSTFVATSVNSGTGIALARDGGVWMTGTNTGAADVPVTPGAFITNRLSDPSPYLVKLSADGSRALYGTYIGVPGNTDASLHSNGAIALAPDGDPWVAPSFFNPPFVANAVLPTTPGSVRQTCRPLEGAEDYCSQSPLLLKIHPGGHGRADVAYGTVLGGGNDDAVTSLAVDDTGNVYAFGTTFSQDIPGTPGAIMPTRPFNLCFCHDMFLQEVHPAGNGPADLKYSTYLGGNNQDGVGSSAMALGPGNTVYVAFGSLSQDIPITPGAFQQFKDDQEDVVVERIRPAGAGRADLLYSTYLGSAGSDVATGIGVDGAGHAFVTGHAGSLFPVRNPLACCAVNKGPSNAGGDIDQGDAFLAGVNPGGHGDADLLFSTFLGGTGTDFAKDVALALDVNGRARAAYLTGTTESTDFPVTPGVFQTTYRGGQEDGFVAKIDLTDLIPCTRTLTGVVAGPVFVGPEEVVCLNGVTLGRGLTVQPGGEARIAGSRVRGGIVSTGAAAFTLCGTDVAGDVTVTDTPSPFVRTTGQGCGPNRVSGNVTLPGGTPATTTTTTTGPSTTSSTSTSSSSTSTTRPTTTSTPPSGMAATCAALAEQLQRTSDPTARQQLEFVQRTLGCPGP